MLKNIILILVICFSLIILNGCGSSDSINFENVRPYDNLYVLTDNHDYQTNQLSMIDLNNFNDTDISFDVFPDETIIHTDANIRIYDSMVFIVNRAGANNIQILNIHTLKTDTQFSVGIGSNFQDVITIDDKLYVSSADTDFLNIFSISTGVLLNQIDLSEYNIPEDNSLDMSNMILVDDKIFLAVQNLEWWSVTGNSKIIVIDTVTDTVDTAIQLSPADNPMNGLHYSQILNKIFIPTIGNNTWGASTIDSRTAIVTLDPTTYELNYLITGSTDNTLSDTEINGNIGTVPSARTLVVVSNDTGYFLWTDDIWSNSETTKVAKFNPSTGYIYNRDVLENNTSLLEILVDTNMNVYISEKDVIQIQGGIYKINIEGNIDYISLGTRGPVFMELY